MFIINCSSSIDEIIDDISREWWSFPLTGIISRNNVQMARQQIWRETGVRPFHGVQQAKVGHKLLLDERGGMKGRVGWNERIKPTQIFILFLSFWSLYIALSSTLEQNHSAHMWFYLISFFFNSAFLNIHQSDVLTALTWLVPNETAAVSTRSLCTPCTFTQSRICKAHALLHIIAS